MRASALALAVLFGSLAIADEPVEEINLLPLTPETLVGQWESLDRHVAMGNLFQPVHGVRKREAVVCFHQEGGQLRGYAAYADHREISHQERWADGRIEFNKVEVADNRVTFEFPIGEWFPGAGPIAVEDGSTCKNCAPKPSAEPERNPSQEINHDRPFRTRQPVRSRYRRNAPLSADCLS